MAETVTVGELLVRIRADVRDLEAGLKQTELGVNSMATRTAPGLRTMQNAFRGLAFSAAGVPGPVGRVSSLLLSMSLGGPVTIGVLAGLAAIGAALKFMAHQASQAEKKWKEMREAMQFVGIHERSVVAAIAGITAQDPIVRMRQLANAMATITDQLKKWRTEAAVAAATPMGQLLAEKGLLGIDPENIRQATVALQLLRQEYDKLLREQMRLGIERIGVGAPRMAEPPSIRGIPLLGLSRGLGLRIEARIQKILHDAALRAQQAKELRQQWQNLGFTIGDYFLEGFRAATERGIGGFLKSLGFTLLRGVIFGAISTATGGTFGAGFGAGSGIPIPGINQSKALMPGAGLVQIDISKMPPATNPLADARDRDWQRFFRESGLVAAQGGYR